MESDKYIWLIWSSSFLIPWLFIYVLMPRYRTMMLYSSVATALFGLTEPLFVPEYWDPPSLFSLAQTTGFDIESLIFCFGIGGVGVVLYSLLTRTTLETLESEAIRHPRHRFHRLILVSPFVVFILLSFFPWNAIYPGIIAMFFGALATLWCRPDLSKKSWVGGAIFVIYYLIFLLALEWSAPGYIDRVWNLSKLSGILLGPFPLEEFLFALAFGMYWSSVYEHMTWSRLKPIQT